MPRQVCLSLLLFAAAALALAGCGGGGGGGTQYTLTIVVEGDETCTVEPASGSRFDAGTIVTLIPHAGTGFVFSHWSGDPVTEEDGVYSIVMDSDKNLTATFTRLQYSLAITVDPEGAGTVTVEDLGRARGQDYEHGNTLRLTPVANEGYSFNHWGGEHAGDVKYTDGEWRLLMDGAKNITAVFQVIEAPTGVSASDGTGDRITITWEAVAEATGYDVYRAVEPTGTYTRLNSVPVVGTTLDDDDPALTYKSFYWYKVKARKGTASSCFSVADRGYIGATVVRIAGDFQQYGSIDGPGDKARFWGPCGIVSDGTNLYIGDSSNHAIRRIVIASGDVSTFAGSLGDSGSADGTGSEARFNWPYGITCDGANLYVADSANHIIRKIDIATGTVTTIAGLAGTPGDVDGTGTDARFEHPRGITTDGTNLYVCDHANSTIRKIVIATGVVTTLAGSPGSHQSADGIGPAARFNYPLGITTDGTYLYVADSGNCTIRRITIATAQVTTLAGSPGSIGATDGIGDNARFNVPSGIVIDGANLYVSDHNNHTIRKIVIATGDVTTIAGFAGFHGGVDGIGSAARFYTPMYLAMDGADLYLADCTNQVIRRLR